MATPFRLASAESPIRNTPRDYLPVLDAQWYYTELLPRAKSLWPVLEQREPCSLFTNGNTADGFVGHPGDMEEGKEMKKER